MTPGELLDRVRDYYVERLKAEIAEQRRAGRTVVVEPAYRDQEGNIVGEGRLGLPARADLMVVDGATVIEAVQVDTDGMLKFKAFTFEWTPAVNVECHPFQWNWCELALRPGSVSLHPIASWFRAWFPTDESHGTDLLGSVHFMSDPQVSESLLRFALDLGSAPVEAFEQLLDAAVEAGATTVTVGAV